jgi:hypothetical protein
VHDIINPGPRPAVSLHVYSPRLTRMTFWSSTSRGLEPLRTTRYDDSPLAVAG